MQSTYGQHILGLGGVVFLESNWLFLFTYFIEKGMVHTAMCAQAATLSSPQVQQGHFSDGLGTLRAACWIAAAALAGAVEIIKCDEAVGAEQVLWRQ